MNPTILLPQDIAAPGRNWLLERGYDLRLMKISEALDEAAICREVVGCAAILARNARITRAVLEAGTSLNVVARHGVGVDNVDIEAATELGIWVTNAPLSNALPVAEWMLGAILSLAARVPQRGSALRRGDFESRNRIVGTDVSGKTLAILGLGNIGKVLARKAALGLDLKIVAPPRASNPDETWLETIASREELFARADFVALCLPATPATRHSIGARELGWMKPDAFLINASRGDIVDERALIRALQTGEIAGAALDVFDPEPPAPDNPLFALQNVIVTPHSAALTREAMERMALDAAQGIHDVLNGNRPQWPVNEPAQTSLKTVSPP